MMSAKTAFPEIPAAAPATTATINTPPGAGGPPSEFQSLLAGAVPAVPAPGGLPQGLSLAQLLTIKTAPQPARLAPAVLPAVVNVGSPGDMLQLLTDSATLLPAGAAGESGDVTASPEELLETEESAKSEDDVLADWLDIMLPPNISAPQAGHSADSQGSGGDSASREAAAGVAIPAALKLLPEPSVEPGKPGAQPSLEANRNATAAAGQNPLAVLAGAMNKPDAAERDQPAADSWMNALGDLTARRGPAAAELPALRLSTPVHDARWADALAHRLVMMARDGESTASLRLVPQDLGPLDIQISVRDGEVNVQFGAAHQETRAALEASLPRLREMLSAQGLQLANASVSHQSAGRNSPERTSGGAGVGAVAEESAVTPATVVSTSLLDIYA